MCAHNALLLELLSSTLPVKLVADMGVEPNPPAYEADVLPLHFVCYNE